MPLNAVAGTKHLLTGTQMTLPGAFPRAWGPVKGQKWDGDGGVLVVFTWVNHKEGIKIINSSPRCN